MALMCMASGVLGMAIVIDYVYGTGSLSISRL